MNPDDEKSSIEDLKNSLYSRNSPDVRTRRKLRFFTKRTEVESSWKKPPEVPIDPVLNAKYEDHSMSFFVKILIGSIIFCVLAVGIGLYLFLNGANLISANNIDITVNGPVSIQGGEPVDFNVAVTNKNNVDLQLVDMLVDFPAGTTNPEKPGQVLSSYRKLIGDLKSGSFAQENIKAIIFGEENTQKQIVVKMTYSVKGSSGVFTKTKTHDVLISSSPINVSVETFDEVSAGQQFPVKVTIKSNSRQILKNVLLKASYPFGFSFISSDMKPLSDNTTWRIGDIPAGGEKVINLIGKIEGEDSDVRVLHFTIGAQSADDSKNIGTQYSAISQNITIQKPFISLKMDIGGNKEAGDTVGNFDQSEQVQISWFNNLSSTVSNVEIKAKLSGTAYDKTYVQPNSGYFQSGTNEIIWNQKTNPELAQVAAGASGALSFNIIPKDQSSAGHQITNPIVSIEVGVSGKRTQEVNVPQQLNAVIKRNIRIASDVELTGRITRNFLINYGPIPPRAESTTTYTVIWTVDNTTSSVGRASVTASLPAYVKWIGNVNPSSENVSFDPNSGQITWSIGNVGTYTVSSSKRREVAFQIGLIPGVSQVGQSPAIISAATLSATDNYTGISLKSTQDALTTRFSTDPTYKIGDEIIVK